MAKQHDIQSYIENDQQYTNLLLQYGTEALLAQLEAKRSNIFFELSKRTRKIPLKFSYFTSILLLSQSVVI